MMKKKALQIKTKEKSFPIVAIGASAGGLEAMSTLLRHLPADTGMAFIYVQHLSPDHKSFLTSILSKLTEMKVQEIEDMEHMLPNNVYVIPHDKGIEVTDGHIILLPRHKKGALNLTIDTLFSSLAETHRANVIGIILSGYASDGVLGLTAIKEAGGLTLAQDDSAHASSMPKSAIEAGVVDFILSPEEIAIELIRFSKNGFSRSKPKESSAENNNSDLNSIFELLLKKTGVDFSHYKMPTIKRRLNHKMIQCGVKTTQDYLKYLLKKNSELDLLYKDLLINVTSFFRETETYAHLKSSIFPKLLKSKTQDETLRIWVTACSTGEEAYSIAMLITELQDNNIRKIPVQIFATDLSTESIQDARLGEYSLNDLKPVSKKYIERFFTNTGDTYRINKELREMCVFAPHNILRDPPFSRMDFISCCNLLIYFDSAAQKKVFSTLHFALNEGGYLMLGKAETVGESSPLFTRINNKVKIYTRKKSTGIRKILELTPRFPRTNLSSKIISPPPLKISSANTAGIDNAINSVLLSHFMPACVVVNKSLEILQFRGAISMFLGYPSGKASLNILKMTRPEFAFELRNAINSCLKTKQPVHKSGIEIEIESVSRLMTIAVNPLKIEWDEPLLLVVFTLQEQVESSVKDNGSSISNSILKDRKIKALLEELNTLRVEINNIIETQETTYEELQAANEEIVSSNEEYQTLNEELETSKEEIEATNEELISTNQELQVRNDLITESQEYSEAIIATIHEPMLVLHKDFRVKSANKSFYKKFLVDKEETEGVSLFDLGNKQWNIPKLREALSDIISKDSSFDNFEVTHTFNGIGEKIMLLNAHLIVQKANKEQLILLAIEDITERLGYYLKEKYARSLIEASLDPLIALNTEGKITDINEATVNITGLSADKLVGTNFFDYFTEPKKAIEVYKQVFAKGFVADFPLTICHTEGKLTDVLFNGSVYKDALGNVHGVVIVARDVTDQKLIEGELREAMVFAELAAELAEEAQLKAESSAKIAEDAMRSKQQFLSNMSHEIRTPLNAIIGFTKIVLKSRLTAKQKEYLKAIEMSGDTLIVLINDILDLAKVDAGKMTFEQIPFKMEISVSAILQLFDAKIQEKNLQLINNYDVKIPEVLMGDPVRLHQIIINLLSNAIKFTSKGKITLKIRLLKENEENARVEFAVTDTGIGIPENKLTGIFENFQQASSGTSRLYGGTGLGLAIVKQLVESQGGTISVKSKINKGSTFSFALDFKKAKTGSRPEPEIAELRSEIKNISILLVEDIALNQLLMKTILDDFGFSHKIASNGKMAIEALKTGTYDVVLMDLHMPEMSGFEATEYIRQKLNSKIPIIALTADVTMADLAKCKAAGMNDYISKPVNEQILYTKIVDWFKKPDQLPTISDVTNHYAQLKCINLDYLMRLTKGKSALLTEMMSLYLKQTPLLLKSMKKSLGQEDWHTLRSVAHRIIPSFAIVGLSKDFEIIAKKIIAYADAGNPAKELPTLVAQLENICLQACNELESELRSIEKAKTKTKAKITSISSLTKS